MISRIHLTTLTLLLSLTTAALLHPPRPTRLPISPSPKPTTYRSPPLTIQVDFADGPLDLPRSTILARIATGASAVATYYGRFPVAEQRASS